MSRLEDGARTLAGMFFGLIMLVPCLVVALAAIVFAAIIAVPSWILFTLGMFCVRIYKWFTRASVWMDRGAIWLLRKSKDFIEWVQNTINSLVLGSRMADGTKANVELIELADQIDPEPTGMAQEGPGLPQLTREEGYIPR